MLAVTAGLLHGLVRSDHPVADLSWERARENFYAAAADGFDADLAWHTAEGDRTRDPERIFEEVFEFARRGLAAQGVDPATRERYLAPLEARWEARTAPADWKKARVRAALSAGESLPDAVTTMQRAYLRRSRETDHFGQWLD
jgi:hypothetical protein